MTDWQPIETAPSEGVHLRGLWVYDAYSGYVLYFDVHAGFLDEDGDFILTDGTPSGWRAEDYEYWMPLDDPPLKFSARGKVEK